MSARLATLLALYNACQAARFFEVEFSKDEDLVNSDERISSLPSTSASRMLKGGRGGGGRSGRSSGYYSGSGGGSSCEGDDCPEWWIGLIVFGGIIAFAVCIIYSIKCYKKCKNKRNPLYIPPP